MDENKWVQYSEQVAQKSSRRDRKGSHISGVIVFVFVCLVNAFSENYTLSEPQPIPPKVAIWFWDWFFAFSISAFDHCNFFFFNGFDVIRLLFSLSFSWILHSDTEIWLLDISISLYQTKKKVCQLMLTKICSRV